MKKNILLIFCIVIIVILMVMIINLVNTNSTNTKTNVFVADKLINVKPLCQYPNLPTGCESVAATMVLNYLGSEITPEEFAYNWLSYSESFYYLDGKLYGPNPNEVFAGNPFTNDSYGCFSNVIINAINNHSSEYTAKSITNTTLEELCKEYIDNNKPLLIWATMSMKESYDGDSWYFEDGSLFTWTAGEHCLVLVGYNKDFYFFNDPLSGSIVAYKKDIVKKRFIELGSQAVYIYKKN